MISSLDRFYDDLLEIHGSDHPKAITFKNHVDHKYGKSIPKWIQKTFTDTCPRCIEKMKQKKTKVGHQPILTKGFGTRGQVDLVDYQSMPDGPFRFLMNYSNHGIKVPVSTPIVAKQASCVAWVLVQIFTLIGPPCILQADDGREFNGAAGKGSRVEIDDKVRKQRCFD